MLFKLLFVSLLVSMSRGDGHERPVGYSCDMSMTHCSTESLTSSMCRSTLTSFMLDAGRHDQNNDCWMEEDETLFDSHTYYDPNDDGYVCIDEFSNRRSEYLGLTEEFSQYMFNSWGQGRCIEIDQFKVDRKMSIDEFIRRNIRTLVEYCNLDNNMMTNRDCWGLSFICEGGYDKTGDACSSYDIGFMSLNKKLEKMERTHDMNGDKTITRDEALNLTRAKHDMDKNNCITRDEYQSFVMNHYGFSAEFAAYVYSLGRDFNSDGCFSPEEAVMDVTEQGYPSEYTFGIYFGFIIDMCHKDPSLWENNPECTMVVDYCRKWYGVVEQCKNINNQCGMRAYERCLDPLANGDCSDERDRWEVKREQMKADNRLSEWCTPDDLKGIMGSTAPKLVAWPVVLLFSFLLTYLLPK